jgi:hypothetical protein
VDEVDDRIVVQLEPAAVPTFGVGGRSLEQPAQVLVGQRGQPDELAAAQQRRVQLEERVLGRRPDEGDPAGLDARGGARPAAPC